MKELKVRGTIGFDKGKCRIAKILEEKEGLSINRMEKEKENMNQNTLSTYNIYII